MADGEVGPAAQQKYSTGLGKSCGRFGVARVPAVSLPCHQRRTLNMPPGHQEPATVFVCVSTECFPELPLGQAMERLAELEFTAVELDIHEGGSHLQPDAVLADPTAAVAACSDLQRLKPVALSFAAPADGMLYEKFDACCRLAKSLGIVTLVVESSELGTPFNGEIERLRKFVAIAASYGMLVGVKTEAERMTQDAETTATLPECAGARSDARPQSFSLRPEEGGLLGLNPAICLPRPPAGYKARCLPGASWAGER